VIINDVLDAGPRRVKRFRVGRGPGSGAGKTSGRGQHGAYSRSGNSMKLGFQGGTNRFFRRIPRRGFNNNAFREEWTTLNLGVLDKLFKAGETVTLELAIERGAVNRNTERLKVLGDGEITKAVTLDATIAVSAPAREKIEKAGGKVGMPAPKKEAPNWRRIASEKERAAKVEAAAKAEKEKAEKAAKADKAEKAERAERAEKAEKAGKTGRDEPGEGKPHGEGQKREKREGGKPAGGEKGDRAAKPAGDKKPKGDDSASKKK
jgi:large subunit ribosomal protein L15